MLAAIVATAIALSFTGVVTMEIVKLYVLGLPALLAGLWIGFKLYGKLALGRSFGIVAANRGVVSSGPYRLVRHPIYLGYLVTHAGFLLSNMSARNVLVYAAAGGGREERKRQRALELIESTDFGTSDWFVGAMKGVIARIAPAAKVVDLTHGLPQGDIRGGAFAVAAEGQQG